MGNEAKPYAQRGSEGLYAFCVLKEPAGAGGGPLPLKEDHSLFVISHRDIGMAVSTVPLSEFAPERLRERLHDLAWLEPRVRRHEEVVERLMRGRAVFPIRFGTVYLGRARVEEFLARHWETLSDSLENLAGKAEWNVRGSCAHEALRERVEEGLERLRLEIETKPPGHAYFLEKKRNFLVAGEMEKKVSAFREEVVGCLHRFSDGLVLNAPLGNGVAGREAVFNAACLVAEERLPGFRRALERLSKARREEGFSFCVSGPWPPYNFSPRLSGGE